MTERIEMRSPSPPFLVPAGYRQPWFDPLTPLPAVEDHAARAARRAADIRRYYAEVMDTYQRYRRKASQHLKAERKAQNEMEETGREN